MYNRLFFLSLFAVSMGSLIHADWLDDLSVSIGSKKEWDQKLSCEILEKYIKQDETNIKEIEDRVAGLKNTEGFWSTFHSGSHKIELVTLKSQRDYHQKVLKALTNLPDNKEDQVKIVQNLIMLYKNNQELADLNKSLENCSLSVAKKIKINAKIVAKKTEIVAKKAYIKSLFLIS